MSDYDTDWSLIDFSEPKRAGGEKSSPVSTCPKCGRKLGRGGHFHVKHCKGRHDNAGNTQG